MRKKLLTTIIYICIITSVTGCYRFSKPDTDGFRVLLKQRAERSLKSFAVLPLFEGGHTGSDRIAECPLTHVAITSGAVPEGAGKKLALTLLKEIKRRTENAHIIPSARSFKVFEDFRAKDVFSYNVETASEIGKKLGVDAVFIGSVLRYAERDGSAFAARKPASIAFTFVLVDVSNARILWAAKFDQTQKPLSDNILKIRSFWNSGMKWLTAKQLADSAAEIIAEKLGTFL